jgi:hypothetical protein
MSPDQVATLLLPTQYPGLQMIESQIAREWVRAHAAEWDSVDFNVNLGTGAELGPGFDQTTRDQARFLTQKRADIIARRGTVANIIEIKRRVDFGPMGQLLGYATLYHADFPDTSDLLLTAIGWDALQDAVEVLHAHGISVETFPQLNVVQVSASGRAT